MLCATPGLWLFEADWSCHDIEESYEPAHTQAASVVRKLVGMSETIALFGTSADPPTIGHRAVLVWLGQQYDRVFVWAADNPFKLDQTPLVHRQEMMKLLVQSLSPPRSNVIWMPELTHRRSLVSVKRVKERWPDAALSLVVGSDILVSLKDWYAMDQLMRLVRFVVVHRPGAPIATPQLEDFRARGGQIEIAEFSGPEVSSSEFRLFRRSEIVPDSVLDYVNANHLYQSEDIHV